MKALILIPLWKRPEVVRFTIKELKTTITEAKIDLEPLFILSPEDPNREELLEIIEGFKFIQFQNYPVGAKMNAGINAALRLEWDYLMNFGSDDTIKSQYFTDILPYLQAKEPFLGLDSCFVVDFKTKKRYYLANVAKEYPIGAGRMLSRQLVEKVVKEQRFNIYTNECNAGLDGDSTKRIRACTEVTPLVLFTNNSPVTDYKTNTNINPIQIICRHLTTIEN